MYVSPKTKTIFGLESSAFMPAAFIHTVPSTLGLYQINPITNGISGCQKYEIEVKFHS
jgi:hypothetical protein